MVLALLLAAILALLAPAPRRFLETVLHRTPAWIFAAPLLFTAVFSGAAALAAAASLIPRPAPGLKFNLPRHARDCWLPLAGFAIAGVVYGAVFRKASMVLSSAALHMLADWTKHFFF